MSGSDFSPVILRKGTIYGFSPRMRYDLVVNTFLKDALSKGRLTIHYGGEMWRPLVDVRDAARAYITCLEADEDKVRGEIFNVFMAISGFRNWPCGCRCVERSRCEREIRPDYRYHGVRSYRVSGKKLERS
jgi:hypothetical protein